MADPHIKEELDFFDKISVCIYRSGFVIAAVATLLLPWFTPTFEIVTLIAATCCASSLHIYMKSYRWVLQTSTWVGLVLALVGFPLVGMGAALLTLGGLAYKEYYCFKVPALNIQPLFCALLWFSIALQWIWIGRVTALVVAVLFGVLAYRKWRMPLHFDIGDRSSYKV